jgi:hypothetical protein
MSLKAIDTGFLRNLVSYDNIGNISLPASLSIFVNKEVATKEYVDAQNSGQVLQSRTLTINGVTYDLSANRSWTINSMVYPSAGIALSSGTGWGTSITNNSANWNTAFGWGNHALAGYVPYTGATSTVNLGTNVIYSGNAIIEGTGALNGALSIKQYVTPLTTGSGYTSLFAGTASLGMTFGTSNAAFFDGSAITANRTYTLPNATGTIALTSNLTGFEVLSNKSNNASLGLSDTLYPTQAAVKSYVDSAVTGGVNIQGDWNANTNTPNISGTTTTGFTWRVSVAGSTNIGGITVWNVNDLAVKTASGWIKIDNSSSVVSVYGRQGVVVANAGDYTTAQVTEAVGSLYFTTARARASFSAGTNVSIDANGVISSTDTNTWNANAKDVAGYVAAPGAVANKVWKTDGSGNPAWRDDADTITTSLAWTSITSRPTKLTDFTNDLGNYGSFLTAESDTLATVTARGSSTAQNITFSNGRKGLVGVYNPAQTQAIFAMGSDYVLTNGGASNAYGPFYGLAWSYNPDHGAAGNNPQSKAGLNWQLLLMHNGITTAAIGSGIWTSGNISAANFSGSHSGTSSGTNTGDQINISGNAATATSAASATISTFVSSPDGDRVSGTKLPNGTVRAVRFDFANANSVTGATGNYAGVMTYSPWDGTVISTGDSSYQLAFINESGVNASGAPGLRFRNGIDSTWNGWTSIITSSNIGSYTAGGVAWTNVSGRPTALSQFTNDLGNYGGWVVRSGDSMSGRLTIDSRASTNLPLHVLSVEPYIQLEATGTSNSTSFRMYPTGGFSAFVGNYATGSLVLVAANAESVFVSGNGNVTSNGGWFINNATSRGLHNSATSMYFASKDSGYYDISSSGITVCSLRLFTGGNQTTLRGYVYANTSNDVGFLHHNGGWSVRTNESGVTLYGNSGSTGTFSATKYAFGSNNTLSGNGLVEIVDMALVGMATQAASYRWYNGAASAILMSLNSSGHLTANAFFEASDIRYKNVTETNPDISGLGIDVIKFTRHGSDMIRYGYSAQQVQAIIPEAVHGEDTLTVNYMDVHTIKIASLERRVKELEERLKSTL